MLCPHSPNYGDSILRFLFFFPVPLLPETGFFDPVAISPASANGKKKTPKKKTTQPPISQAAQIHTDFFFFFNFHLQKAGVSRAKGGHFVLVTVQVVPGWLTPTKRNKLIRSDFTFLYQNELNPRN